MPDEILNQIRQKIRETVVYHDYVTEALSRAKMCYDGASGGVDPRGMLIIGESGSGKTKVLDLIEAEYPSYRDADGMHMDLMRISIHSNPTVKGLVTEMLSVLGDPGYDKGTEQAKTIKLRKQMKHAGVKVLMLDEFQHFVDQGGKRVQHHVADWLKLLVDDLKISLIVAGLPNCQQVFETNTQLKRRFYRPVLMPTFTWRDKHYRKSFLDILKTLQDEISEVELPNLCDPDTALQINLATGGLIGRLVNMLIEVVCNAYSKNDRRVTLKDITCAVEQCSYDVAKEAHHASFV